MKKLTQIVCIAAIILGMGTVAVIQLNKDPLAPDPNWPEVMNAKISEHPCEITVGENVRINAPHDSQNFQLGENVLIADPNDGRIIYSAVMMKHLPATLDSEIDIAVFCSQDRGKTWQLGHHFIAESGHRLNDPTIAVNEEGDCVVSFMDVDHASSLKSPRSGTVAFHESKDHGQSWTEFAQYPNYFDRPWIEFDRTESASRGNLYCLGNKAVWEQDEFIDANPIFLRFKRREEPHWEIDPHIDGNMVNCKPSKPVVLSDGEVIVAFADRYVSRKLKTTPRPIIYVAASRDGGQTFEMRTTVNREWWHDSFSSGGATLFQMLAAVPKSDRIYCVWEDGSGIDGVKIFFSYSTDRARSWSHPVVISEQSLGDLSESYMSFIPQIAVNNNGHIAVTWYDRRGLPPSKRVPVEGRPSFFQNVCHGWNVRLTISTDGGATWHPSVQLNERSGTGGLVLGHTAGLTSLDDGTFCASWIDNRDGQNDLWMCPIEVFQESDAQELNQPVTE